MCVTYDGYFSGHLSGLIVGYLFTRGPLRMIMDKIAVPFTIARKKIVLCALLVRHFQSY